MLLGNTYGAAVSSCPTSTASGEVAITDRVKAHVGASKLSHQCPDATWFNNFDQKVETLQLIAHRLRQPSTAHLVARSEDATLDSHILILFALATVQVRQRISPTMVAV